MYTLVIADDEQELRQALINTVDWESIGFKVVGEAENGVEALEMVEKLEPDLLLTDIKMPFLTGIELAREVRSVNPAMNIAFLSGYDDFAYAQQAIQYNIISYILKPVSASEIRVELMNIKAKMDAKREALVSSEEYESSERIKEEYENRIYLLKLLFDGTGMKPLDENDNYILQVTSFKGGSGEPLSESAELHLVNSIIEKYCRCLSVFVNDRIITLIMESHRNLNRYTPLFSKEIVQNARKLLNYETTIGISNIYDVINDTNIAYLEAMEAFDYAATEDSGISIFSDYDIVSAKEQFHIGSVVDEIIRILKTESEDVLREYISNVFRDIDNSNGIFVSQMMVSIYETICNLVGSGEADELANQILAGDVTLNRLMKKQSESDITNFAVAARQMIFAKRKAAGEIICDDVMKIISEEYGDETLTLASVSDRLHVSISYLSTLVKKVSTKSFVTLLTEKRMETAKELLLYSPKKILEIAMECGYSDNHYFSYSFKKYFGVSPRKMRENLANEEK